jgi:cell division protein FtsB
MHRATPAGDTRFYVISAISPTGTQSPRGFGFDVEWKLRYDNRATGDTRSSFDVERMNAMSRPPFQFVLMALLVASIYLVIDFSQRISTSLQLTATQQQLKADVAQLSKENQLLLEEKARVTTPAFIEEYARKMWRWVRDPDTLVITSPAPIVTPAPAAIAPPNQPWWQNLFDSLRFLLP